MCEISNDEVKKELRKYEKKLRQIIHLEQLGRELTKEELAKVNFVNGGFRIISPCTHTPYR